MDPRPAKWIVSLALVPGDVCPATIVEADSPPEAAVEGVAQMADSERGASGGWGVECGDCERVRQNPVLVVPLDGVAVMKFEPGIEWVEVPVG